MTLDLERADARRRRVALAEFYDLYESFVEVLMDAANYGPSGRGAILYQETRARIVASFAPLRPFLDGYAFGRRFDRLWRHDSLTDALDADGGELIPAIVVTRDALNMYAEHLRALAGEAA